MAAPSCTSSLFVLCLLVITVSTQVNNTSAGRQVIIPASSEKKQKECLDDHEGTVLIPGIGRYMIGSHDTPDITGLDNSGPAAVHSQYLPGNDDGFVPNPGFEVPNPAGGAAGGGGVSLP